MCVRKSISRQVGHHSKTRQGSRQAQDESMRRRHEHNHWKAAHKEELHKKHERQHHKHELEKPAGPHRRDVPNSKNKLAIGADFDAIKLQGQHQIWTHHIRGTAAARPHQSTLTHRRN